MSWFHWDGEDLILQVKVQARAGRDGFAAVVDDCLKVRIAAAPVEGQANARLVSFLAQQFGVAKAKVVLLQGHKGKIKVVRIRAPAKTPAELEIGLPSERF